MATLQPHLCPSTSSTRHAAEDHFLHLTYFILWHDFILGHASYVRGTESRPAADQNSALLIAFRSLLL